MVGWDAPSTVDAADALERRGGASLGKGDAATTAAAEEDDAAAADDDDAAAEADDDAADVAGSGDSGEIIDAGLGG